MPEDIIASSNPVTQQGYATPATPAAEPIATNHAQTPKPAESTVQISDAAIQQLNSERSATSGAVPTELTGEVTPAEAPQAANATTATQAPPQASTAPVDNGQGLGQLMDLYA